MDDKRKKENISISVHIELLKMIEDYCKENKIKKSKFIENMIKEHFINKNNK